MRDFEKLGAEARALFHASTGYCASPKARARAAWLARQEEKKACKIELKRKPQQSSRNDEIK